MGAIADSGWRTGAERISSTPIAKRSSVYRYVLVAIHNFSI
jgi:hypothetical protein